jgi:hypothetical protein
MITYNLTIQSLEVLPTINGLNDVVDTVHWKYFAKDNSIIEDVYGSIKLSSPEISSFIAYDNITEENIKEWVENNLDLEYYKQILNKKINKSKEQKKSVPWEPEQVNPPDEEYID